MEGLFTVLQKALPYFTRLSDNNHFTNNQPLNQVRHALQTFSSYVKGRGQMFVEFISSLINSDIIQDVILSGHINDTYDDEIIGELMTVVNELREVTGISEGAIPLSFTNCLGKQITLVIDDTSNILTINDGVKNILEADYQTGEVVAESRISMASAQLQGEYMEIGDFLNDQINSSSINHIITSAVDLINAATFSLETFSDVVGQWISNAAGNVKNIYQSIRQSYVNSGIVGVIHYIYNYILTLSQVQVTNNAMEFTDNKSLMPKDILTGFLGVTNAVLSAAWNIVKTTFTGIAGVIVGVFDFIFKTVDAVVDLTRPTLNDSIEDVVYPTTPMGFFQLELNKTCFEDSTKLDAITSYAADGNYALCEVPGGFLIVGPGKDDDHFRCEFHASIRELYGCNDEQVMDYFDLEKAEVTASTGYYLTWVGPKHPSTSIQRYLTSQMIRDLYAQSEMPIFTSVHDDHKIYSNDDCTRLIFNIIRNICIFNVWLWTLMSEANDVVTPAKINLNNYLSTLYASGPGIFSNFFGMDVKKVGGVNPLLGVLCPGWFISYFAPNMVYRQGHPEYDQSWWEILACKELYMGFTWLEQGDWLSEDSIHADIYTEVGNYDVWNTSSTIMKKDYNNWNLYGFFSDIHLLFNTDQYTLGSNLCSIFETYEPIFGEVINASVWASKRAKSIVELPKVSLSSLTSFMTVILGVAVATAVLVPVIATSIKKARLRSQGKVERAWTAFTEDPSESNLKNYRKTVFKANLLGTIIGGTHFSNTNYWDSGSPESSRSISNFTDGISSLTEQIRSSFSQEENTPMANIVGTDNIQNTLDRTALSTDEKLANILRLINGSGSSSGRNNIKLNHK